MLRLRRPVLLSWHASFPFSFGLIAILSLPGCGSSESPRIAGGGMIKRNGDAVTGYMVTFTPDKDVSGPAAATTTANGRYAFTKKTGPAAPGTYRVVIEEPIVPIPRTERDQNTAKDRTQQHWEFEYSVPSGNFVKDFDLD